MNISCDMVASSTCTGFSGISSPTITNVSTPLNLRAYPISSPFVMSMFPFAMAGSSTTVSTSLPDS